MKEPGWNFKDFRPGFSINETACFVSSPSERRCLTLKVRLHNLKIATTTKAASSVKLVRKTSRKHKHLSWGVYVLPIIMFNFNTVDYSSHTN